MMNLDIELFHMDIGYSSFTSLNIKGKEASFHHYGGTLDDLPDWSTIVKRNYADG